MSERFTARQNQLSANVCVPFKARYQIENLCRKRQGRSFVSITYLKAFGFQPFQE
jgi:hypothetical protein